MLTFAQVPFWLAAEHVAESFQAAQSWWRDEDVPDPIHRQDFRRRPDLLARAIGDRWSDGDIWARVRTLPAPKPSGGTRTLTCVDPIADVAYRQLVGRVVRRVEAALPKTVFSTRCDFVGATWRTQGWRKAKARFNQAIASEIEDDWCTGKGTLDVAQHYPTVDLDRLAVTLTSVAASPIAIRDIIETLRTLQNASPGLPIGPEGSAVLGAVALIPLDRRLRNLHATALRWMDDVVTPVAGQDEYERIKQTAADQLKRGGQELNLDKCTFDDFGFASEPTFAELFASGGDGEGRFVDPAYELELRAEFQERDRMPALLGQLKRQRNPDGIDVLRNNQWIVAAFPKQCATYLKAVDEAIDDWTWLVDFACEGTTDETVLAQLRVARLLPRSVISPQTARTFIDKALLLSWPDYAPLANQLFASAGQSHESTHARRDRALELAMELASLDTVRALLSPFLEGTASGAHRSGIARLARQHAGLSAMQELVIAA